jgi:hypothetical protein
MFIRANTNAAEMTALLRVMVLKGAPYGRTSCSNEARACADGRGGGRLLAAFPAYLAQRRALLDAHCPLIAPLLAIVRGYDPEPTTTEELWATGLGVDPQGVRRPRVEVVVALPVRRSACLRQWLE